ncbi:energy-coupling factor ABC transporter permease [Demequina soli]|uniref:energy-coupling factor ABC transporter permease n=1 Tax=Demequina soli TaxID=1638987 RepID=UPI000781E8C6|nr:energy-coupling factor ABC transporter permease [Demequina soli]
MHIQDGVLDPTITIGAGVAALGAVTYAGWTMRHGRPRLGAAVAGAGGVLIAHLLDLPLNSSGSLTGHVIGGTLLAIALGPWLALIAMAGALVAEALLWGDGGVTALGANVLVMGVVGILAGWCAYRGAVVLAGRLRGAAPGDALRAGAAGLAGVASVIASSLVLMGIYALGAPGALAGVSFGALAQHYVAWAVLEGAVTGALVAVALGWAAHRARARWHADTLGVGHRQVHVLDGDLEALG